MAQSYQRSKSNGEGDYMENRGWHECMYLGRSLDPIRGPRTPRGSTVLSKVSDLLDPYTGSWDIEPVKDIFWEEDVNNILAIPVHAGREDSVAWHFDHKGVLSVKSAYHVLEDEAEILRVRQKGESSTSRSMWMVHINWSPRRGLGVL